MNKRDWTSYLDQPFTEEELAEVNDPDELDPEEASELLESLAEHDKTVYKGSIELADGTIVRSEEESEEDESLDSEEPHIPWLHVGDLIRWALELVLVLVGVYKANAILNFIVSPDGLNAVDRVYAKFGSTMGNKFAAAISVFTAEPRLIALIIAACFLVLELIIAVLQGIHRRVRRA